MKNKEKIPNPDAFLSSDEMMMTVVPMGENYGFLRNLMGRQSYF